ncbi:DUF1295 domain-containing protein [Marinicella sp. W31]|uniref:DUF1295 domain-containing protein n=1 Tax=Marinicella sp. W31 TaxID=3023713 RepID=UPI00375709B9
MAENPLILSALVCLMMQTAAWLWQWKTNNADIVDITWCFSIVVSALIYFHQAPGQGSIVYMIILFPIIWYARLGIHLLIRYRIEHEDSRYQNLRSHWSQRRQFKFFWFFVFQAFLGWLFALPAFFISASEASMGLIAGIAVAIGLVAFIGASIADKQLYQFKSNPANKGKVCDTGLWRYSRHPNYFFEWTHWFVYPLLSFQTEYFYWSLLFPVLMLVFLLKITGIPFAEQQALKNRGEVYRQYQLRTNKFFLGNPKHD